MVTVNLFAAARAAAGQSELQLEATTMESLKEQLVSLNLEMQRIIPQCSYLLNGIACQDFRDLLKSGDQVDVLPMFAGG